MSDNELIVIPSEKALDIFTAANGLDPYVDEIRKEVTGFVADISTEKGRKAVASMAYKVAKSKTALDNIGKELVSKLKEQPKLVDAERKRMREALDALRDEVRQPLNDWEAAETARCDAHTANIATLWAIHEDRENKTASELKEMVAQAESFVIDDSLQEFKGKAMVVKDKVLTDLRADLEKEESIEAERAELERLRKEAADREQKEREEKIAKEAEERATKAAEEKALREKQEAEAKANAEKEAVEQKAAAEKAASERRERELKEAAEKAEREKLEAEERARQAAIDTENRLKREAEQKIADEKAAQEKREANTRHAKKINNEAAEGFKEGGFTESQAKEIVTLIAKGEIKNVFINY